MKICKDGRIWGQNNKTAKCHLGVLTTKKYVYVYVKKGYNPNSAFPLGQHHSKEHIRKLREITTKRWQDPEERKKMSKPRSEDVKANMKGHSGVYKRTTRHRKILSNAHKGKKFPKEEYPNYGWRGKHLFKEHIEKMRISVAKAWEKRVENSDYPRNYFTPNFNFNSILVFQALDKVLHTRSRCGGTEVGEKKIGKYFVDYFNKKYQFIIEWNEEDNHNYYPKEYDAKKRKYILARYPDYTYITINQDKWFKKGDLTENIAIKIVNHILIKLVHEGVLTKTESGDKIVMHWEKRIKEG